MFGFNLHQQPQNVALYHTRTLVSGLKYVMSKYFLIWFLVLSV